MTQTSERESLASLAGRGSELAKRLENATRPAEILLLAQQIEAICSQLRERAHRQKQPIVLPFQGVPVMNVFVQELRGAGVAVDVESDDEDMLDDEDDED